MRHTDTRNELAVKVAADRPHMPFFHVVAELDDAPGKPVALFSDLSRQELQTRFVGPYERGIDLLSGNSIFPVRRLRKIRIVQTNEPSEAALAKLRLQNKQELDELNRDSSVLFLSIGDGHEVHDVVQIGTDITETIVSGPPGSKAGGSAVGALLNNGWVVGIGGGMIVAILVWYFNLS